MGETKEEAYERRRLEREKKEQEEQREMAADLKTAIETPINPKNPLNVNENVDVDVNVKENGYANDYVDETVYVKNDDYVNEKKYETSNEKEKDNANDDFFEKMIIKDDFDDDEYSILEYSGEGNASAYVRDNFIRELEKQSHQPTNIECEQRDIVENLPW